MLKKSKRLDNEVENVTELTAQAQEFASKQLLTLKALQIA